MGKRRILVIDAHVSSRETMQYALEAAGYATMTAATATERLTVPSEGGSWDLVVVDLPPTGNDRCGLLSAIRQWAPQAPIVVVTRDAPIELAVEAMKRGAVDVLCKPFSPDLLRQAVRQALALPSDASSPTLAARPVATAPDVPPFSFVTLNGFQFWPVDLPEGGEETSAMRIRRAFEIKAPDHAAQRCAVELTTTVRQLVSDEAGRDHPPTDRIWDTVCKSALSDYLWQRAEMPPGVLTVFDLTDKQMQIVRNLLGIGTRRRP